MQESDGVKVTVEKQGEGNGTGEKGSSWDRRTVKGRKEVRVDVTKGKLITGMMSGRKETGKKGKTENAAGTSTTM